MGEIILADASPIIYLAQLENGLSWLKEVYGPVGVTPVVRDELLPAKQVAGKRAIEEAFRLGILYLIETPWTTPQFAELDPGEASTLRAVVNLVHEGNACLILIDDKNGREVLETLHLNLLEVSGTAAFVGRLKRKGMIKSAAAELSKLRDLGFRLSDEIIRQVVDSAGEGSTIELPPTKAQIPRGPRKRRR
jgi:predicted nucleic acid-binding protein